MEQFCCLKTSSARDFAEKIIPIYIIDNTHVSLEFQYFLGSSDFTHHAFDRSPTNQEIK